MNSLSLFLHHLCLLIPTGPWKTPELGVQCKRVRAEMYTFDTSNNCDGWSNTDLPTCKQYCENNELPNGCNPPDYNVCKYVIWNSRDNWCHLGIKCTEEPQEVHQVVEFQKGILLSQYMLCMNVVSYQTK